MENYTETISVIVKEFPESKIEVADFYVNFVVALATVCVFIIILIQAIFQRRQLQYMKKDFEHRNKSVTIELVSNHLRIVGEPDKAKLINNILNRDPHYDGFEHDVRYLLNLHEKMAIDYYALQLDLDIIDESLGNEITRIYDNIRVKQIREDAQNGTDLYNKLDIFQKELKLMRNNKIRKKKN